MPWKPTSGGSAHKSKSIRGQISAPILIPSLLDEQISIQEQSVILPAPDVNLDHDENLAISEANIGAKEHQEPNNTDLKEETQPTATSIVNGETLANEALETTSTMQVKPVVLRKYPAMKSPSHRRHSTLSNSSDKRDSKVSKPQKRKSTFRSTLSRIFGRKKKSEAKGLASISDNQSSPALSIVVSSPHHHSDPSGQCLEYKKQEPIRSFSTPITEYDRALRSHSIGPGDVMAIQSARNSISADLQLSPKEQTFTALEPLAHSATHRWTGDSSLAGLSPRPASSLDRIAGMTGIGDDLGEIGRAISSDSSHCWRRRSRSLSAMPSLDVSPQGTVRRRSAEIRYWRESYVAPLTSSASTAAETTLPLDDHEEKELHYSKGNSSIEQSDVTKTMDDVQKTPTPIKLEEAPEAICLEGRVGNLESRMNRIEGIVLQLGSRLTTIRNQTGGQYNQAQQPGSRKPQQQSAGPVVTASLRPSNSGLTAESRQSTSRPSTRHSESSKMTFGPGETALLYPYGETWRSYAATPSQGVDAPEKLSTDTVSSAHYYYLLALLETERSARQSLEANIKTLSRQFQLVNKGPAYSSTFQNDFSSFERSMGEVSVFDHDDEEDEDRRMTATKFPCNSTGIDDSGIATETRSDDEYAEPFVTPLEGNKGPDINGDDNDVTLKSGHRQQSLSQLTMGNQPIGTPT